MRAIVVIPTYNEKGNIDRLIGDILLADPLICVVIVDDSSPDGTGQIVENLRKGNSRVHLITRPQKSGRAKSDLEGYRYALDRGFDVIFSMDADFSHQPKDIPRFLEKIKSSDIVIGSRLIAGGQIQGRGFLRNILTRLANFYVRIFLGFEIHDWTSGFRCYRREVLAALPLDKMISRGPSLLEEILFLCRQKGAKAVEIPVVFVDREQGISKLKLEELIEVFGLVLTLRFRKCLTS
ncbi:MAG: polyprenol monophosphomannose synthase [Candidatus Omnitrophota bacterium]